MSLLSEFQAQLQHSRYLIAFSGGADSTALLALFAKSRQNRPHLQLRAIHIHHGLNVAANDWAAHCRRICEKLEVPLIIERVEINKKSGIEQGAREARYAAIRCHRHADEIVATAHHLQDQTETFLLALKRGSGIKGLGAMQRESRLYGMPIFRPLLPFGKTELENYLRAQSLDWIEDDSNADNRYDRNFLRNRILPVLRRRWTDFDLAVSRSAQHCYEQERLIRELLTPAFEKNYRKTDRTFALSDFAGYSPNKQNALLRMWLTACRVPMPEKMQLAQLIRDVVFAKPDAVPQFVLGEQVIRRYQNRLYLTPHYADVTDFRARLTVNKTVELPDNLGRLHLIKNTKNLTALWQYEDWQYSADFPLGEQQISVGFGYAGKVKLHARDMSRDIKKVWQKYAVPPWRRTRIPLIFVDGKLKSAVGFFDVF
ncbi:tRNA(Ile)-lysidine synthetase [Actinobacillus succinogenes]|uniref:tRNA(Ile)-lysidine synthase n=1 Tax=Actinobacillus succinogenes (strain ATCC 55618 / DSM 22257 / CCUG 43843 / 130Z) TaxID=339671 RepID=TILS_ACTSZ|nr:tRNA lysidine(34) synthetase TilS [Actinobacillus succinogenes]A6VNE4.1 RecName: Full=tRNA(Ile)-lysidine synthase; AltName: Full=tRNA(Ile)-2-lysyl-cytidine synthase; AltName: Full=tRNA(Ile)-lysidine synthetase [Actinobacillus succinogenes 130Z]ABR74491.1 tRNA(Ile)-lysidine synthetase [Actinobacillus succinogenes 130Z]PHI41090.1 tRNA(Ile)-lysidine synthetase [Actinobacillus succinogenes]